MLILIRVPLLDCLSNYRPLQQSEKFIVVFTLITVVTKELFSQLGGGGGVGGGGRDNSNQRKHHNNSLFIFFSDCCKGL